MLMSLPLLTVARLCIFDNYTPTLALFITTNGRMSACVRSSLLMPNVITRASVSSPGNVVLSEIRVECCVFTA